jgi:hypothetical protein
MKQRNTLIIAQNLLRRRKFSDAITLLDSRREIYRDSFSYYLTIAIAYLYLGDIGNARSYFQRASSIDDSDVNLLLGQAVIYLRNGDTDKALAYYLDVLDNDPTNPVAKNAMAFIQKNSDFETISAWVDDGRIEQFYPPLGVNPDVMCIGAILGFLLAAALLIVIIVPRSLKTYGNKNTHKLYQAIGYENFELSATEIAEAKNAAESGAKPIDYYDNLYNNITKNLLDSYRKGISDNKAQIEYNRLMLDPSAPETLKTKASMLIGVHIKEPSFNEFFKGYKDYKSFAEKMHDAEAAEGNFTIDQVIDGGELYRNCWVVWGGRLSAISVGDDNLVHFILHVGEYGNEYLSRDAYVTCVSKIQLTSITDDYIMVLAKITGFNARGEPLIEAKMINQQSPN